MQLQDLTLVTLLVLSLVQAHSFVETNKLGKGENSCCMMGASGPPGIPGVPGMHGHRGQDGNKGDKGERGYQGEPGMTGMPGPIGSDGARGRKGPKGEFGPEGPSGLPGPVGERGYPGLTGDRGPTGNPAPKSRHVAFSAARSVKLGPVTEDTPIFFDTVFTNAGSAFDEYSSHFVCKINGTYLFTAHILGQNNHDAIAWMMLNSKHKAPLHGDGRAGYGTGSQTVILHLRSEDHVWLQLGKESAILNDYSTFSGFLLFED